MYVKSNEVFATVKINNGGLQSLIEKLMEIDLSNTEAENCPKG